MAVSLSFLYNKCNKSVNMQIVTEGTSLFIPGYVGDLQPVFATDVTSHLWAEVLRQHLVWDAYRLASHHAGQQTAQIQC